MRKHTLKTALILLLVFISLAFLAAPHIAGATGQEEIKINDGKTLNLFERLALEDPNLGISTKIQPFGQGIFTGAENTAPENLPVAPDYPVGYGDEIGVMLWGRVSGEYLLKVSREGTISLPMIGPVVVNGLTFSEVRELISRKVKSIVGAEVAVTMGRLRSIQVFVLGEVGRPGAYKVGAISTVSGALMSAGGAASIGSLRGVELRRAGEKPRQIDFYDLLLKGDKSGDLRLRNGDVVFVPVIGAVAGVAGNVKRPAMYEMKGPTSLYDALELAGGVVPTAYTQQVQVERIEGNKKRVVIDINAADSDKARSFTLKDGDFVKVLSITGKDTNAVYLYGNVKRPGKYELKPGMKLGDLITGFSDLLEETHLTYGVIKRQTPELNTMVIPFNTGALLNGSEAENQPLQPLDSVYIFSTWLFRDRPVARIEGEVRKPGPFNIEENLTVKDLVLLAGGLTKDASYGEYELYRKDKVTQKITLSRLDLGKALQGEASENPVLRDSDVVRVHSALETEPERTVIVYGMVNRPGEYTYASNMKVSDLVFAGGGLKESAYMKEAELASYEVEDGRTSKVTYRTLDLEKALAGDDGHNELIKPYDILFVREMTDWRSEQYVEVKGEVKFPGRYVFKKGEQLSSVIKRAGGFTTEAYLKGAVFTRESVRELQQNNLEEAIRRLEIKMLADGSGQALASTGAQGPQQIETATAMRKELLNRLRSAKAQGRISIKLDEGERFSGSSYDVALENGDTLYVPVKPTQVQVMGAVQNPSAFIFEQSTPVSSYIGKAGGYNEVADEGRIFVLKGDGTAMSRNNSWSIGLGFMSSRLDPGDTVVVPEKLDKGLWLREAKDITQILYQIAVTAGVLLVAF
jgi:polysaccharide export outer membrane protein